MVQACTGPTSWAYADALKCTTQYKRRRLFKTTIRDLKAGQAAMEAEKRRMDAPFSCTSAGERGNERGRGWGLQRYPADFVRPHMCLYAVL